MMSKKLTKSEHLEMELNLEQLKNLRLEKELGVHKKQIKLLQSKVTELEVKQQIRSVEDTMQVLDAKIKRCEEEVKSFNEKIKTKYKLNGKFGINPDTGEIIED